MHTVTIGIAGGSGSGKTTLAQRIMDGLGESTVLLFQHDAYYFDLGRMPDPDPARINYDHPESLETELCVAHLRALKRGEQIRQPVYDFSTHRRLSETRRLEPRPVILVEGILVLAEETLRAEMDLRVYVDADADICLLRRMERDITVRGRSVQSVRDQYYSSVRPMFDRFVAPSRQFADVIVPRGGKNAVAQSLIVGYLKNRLAETASGGS